MKWVLFIFVLSACLPPVASTPTSIVTRAPTFVVENGSPTPPPEAWTGLTRLIVHPEEGAWLRSEPSHLAAYEGMPVIAQGTGVRVIGQPFYEAEPGQWWWLVDAETGDIGWVEEASLRVAPKGQSPSDS